MTLLEDLLDNTAAPVRSRTATRPPGPRSGPNRDRPATASSRSAFLRRFVAGAGSRLRPWLIVITPNGALVIGSAVALFLVSRLTGWSELALTAGGLAAAFVVAGLFTVGRSRYAVRLELRTTRVTVGERASGRMLVENVSGRRLFPVRMELPVGSAVGTIAVPSLGGHGEHEQLFVVPTERRAVVQVGPARSVRGDAFGLWRRVIRWTDPQFLYVHPRTVPLEGTNPGFLKDLEGRSSRDLSNNDLTFHALRTYVPGDDRRYIHWKSSARTGVFMVRQFEETRRSHLAIALSTRSADYGSPQEFETAVSACASLGKQSFREQHAVSVVADGRKLQDASSGLLLDGLSGLNSDGDAPGIVAIGQFTAAMAPDASIAILVCGSGPAVGDVLAAARAFPPGVRVLALRVVDGVAVSVRRVGTIPVVTFGRLDELGRALRAAMRL